MLFCCGIKSNRNEVDPAPTFQVTVSNFTSFTTSIRTSTKCFLDSPRVYLTEGGGETLSNLQGYPSTQEARTTLGRLSLGGHKTTHGRETEMHPAQHRLRDSATFLPGVSV